jgi:hypothetical protein
VANFSSRSISYTGGATSISITSNAQLDKDFPKFKAILETSLLSKNIKVYSKAPETDSLAYSLQINELKVLSAHKARQEDEFSHRYFIAPKEEKAFFEVSAYEYFGVYPQKKDFFRVNIPTNTYYLNASLYNKQKELLAKVILKVQDISCQKQTFVSTAAITDQENMTFIPHWDNLNHQNLRLTTLKCLASHAAVALKEKRPQIFRLED